MTSALATFADRLLAELQRNHPLARPARLSWRRFRTTAGRAVFEPPEIHLSALVLDDEDKVRDTLIHEYAHLLAAERAGPAGRGHGAPWKAAMIELGAKPERTHGYACQRNLPRREVIYACRRCGAQFLRRRRLARGRRWAHVGCGGALALLGVWPVQED